MCVILLFALFAHTLGKPFHILVDAEPHVNQVGRFQASNAASSRVRVPANGLQATRRRGVRNGSEFLGFGLWLGMRLGCRRQKADDIVYALKILLGGGSYAACPPMIFKHLVSD